MAPAMQYLSLIPLFLSIVSSSAILDARLGLIQVAYRPQSINQRIGAKDRQAVLCPVGMKECGVLCINNEDICCTTTPDESGGCRPGTRCAKGDNGKWGCCPDGSVCFGDGGAVTRSVNLPLPTSTGGSPHFVIPTIHMPPPFSFHSIDLPPIISDDQTDIDVPARTTLPEVPTGDDDVQPAQPTGSDTLPTENGNDSVDTSRTLATPTAASSIDDQPTGAESTATGNTSSETPAVVTSGASDMDLVSEGWVWIGMVAGIVIGGLVL